MESRHPGGSTIYKISYGGASVVYATDYEPESDAPPDFCAFARGCSLLPGQPGQTAAAGACLHTGPGPRFFPTAAVAGTNEAGPPPSPLF